jgi:hypothetical protein
MLRHPASVAGGKTDTRPTVTVTNHLLGHRAASALSPVSGEAEQLTKPRCLTTSVGNEQKRAAGSRRPDLATKGLVRSQEIVERVSHLALLDRALRVLIAAGVSGPMLVAGPLAHRYA